MKKSSPHMPMQFNMPKGYWISLGVAFGLLYGMMWDDTGLGVMVGISLGAATGAWILIRQRRNSKKK